MMVFTETMESEGGSFSGADKYTVEESIRWNHNEKFTSYIHAIISNNLLYF